MRTVESFEADAIRSLDGENATHCIVRWLPLSMVAVTGPALSYLDGGAVQTLTVVSTGPEATRVPSEEKATQFASLV